MNNQSGLYILLAAGFSRRFGSPKLLHALPSGKSIINTSIDALKASGCRFVVVIREDDSILSNQLNTMNVRLIKVSSADKGLSSVIAEATAALGSKPEDWIGICLADMPYIQPQTLTGLSKHVSSNTIVRPRYQGKPGHPVIFGSDYFDELKKLSGDDGAKLIIKRFPHALHTIESNDPMVLHDIDRPEHIHS